MDQPKILSNIFSLAGWAQKPNSLDPLFSSLSSPHKIINFDYTRFSNVKDCFNEVENLSTNPDIVIGWSLGGQIAARLIANKILTPKLLILIAAPFQFVKSEQIAAAMPKASFEIFRDNFIKNSVQTLEKFSLLMMLNNAARAKELAKNLYVDEKNYDNLVFWLDELSRFSCYDLDFSNFPRTIIFHGQGDLVVHASQSKIFASKIANSRLEILNDCGHCPHISNQDQLQKIINEEINRINDR
jgi:pimeloyl-ACP methyl ester carboxylesterase